MSFSYFDYCKEVSGGLDPNVLGDMPLGARVGSGSKFSFRQLGEITLPGNEQLHTGLKVPTRRGATPLVRGSSEIALIGLLIDRAPELAALLPRFICMVEVADSPSVSLLTEDVSQGGTKSVQPINTSQEVQRLLYEPFRDQGSMAAVLDDEELRGTLSFDVDGEERLLDFTPYPIESQYLFADASPFNDYLYEAMTTLTEAAIVIPKESVLGAELDDIAESHL